MENYLSGWRWFICGSRLRFSCTQMKQTRYIHESEGKNHHRHHLPSTSRRCRRYLGPPVTLGPKRRQQYQAPDTNSNSPVTCRQRSTPSNVSGGTVPATPPRPSPAPWASPAPPRAASSCCSPNATCPLPPNAHLPRAATSLGPRERGSTSPPNR